MKEPKRLRAAIETQLIHAGEEDLIEGAVVTPIFQSATFESQKGESYDDIRYIRLNNTPSHRVVQEKLAAVCEAEAAVVAGSGMAAISTTLIALLRAGDHLLVQDCLYGGTRSLLREDISELGIEFDLIRGNRPDTWGSLVRPTTRLIYVESMTNPLLEVTDLEAVVSFARQRELICVIDSTFTPPTNFKPLKIGFDLELHSCTKYLNGHSDIVAGCAVGGRELIGRITHKLNHLGGTLDPHACFLLQRGMKTLALRVRQQNENGLSLSRYLDAHPEIEIVNYPGLPTHPQHERAKQLFGGFGGVLSFELAGDVDRADRLIDALLLPASGPSLGGVETLITRPAATSHRAMSPADRRQIGLSDRLIRLAVGIEAEADLRADFDQALRSV